MHPNVFVSERFFDFFDSEYNKLPEENLFSEEDSIENKRKSLYRIRDLFLASDIYTDIKDKTVVKHLSKQLGTFSDFKNFILHRKIGDASYANGTKLITNQNIDDCDKSGVCFFVDYTNIEACIASRQKGKIILGENFLSQPFYLESTFGNRLIKDWTSFIETEKHPCSGIIIMDRYLFRDKRDNSKIEKLILFLNKIISQDLNTPFEVDIITENINNNGLYERKFNEILNIFGDKISLHVYAPYSLDYEFKHDRLIVTNYAVYGIQLPFEEVTTNVSCSFFPSNNSIQKIKDSYSDHAEIILVASSITRKTRDSFGFEIKTTFKSDNIEHSIFNV